jgi:hypothetical protein
MQTAEQGRHCQSCQKIVVDFTTMTDQQVLNYLAKAGPHICGRLAPDQINRSLIPLAPPQRNGWSGWRLLLAGALITSTNPPLQPDPPAKPEINGNQQPTITCTTTAGMMLTGEVLKKYSRIDTVPVRLTEIRIDSSYHLTGVIALAPDSGYAASDTIRDQKIMEDTTVPNAVVPTVVSPIEDSINRPDIDEVFISPTDTLQNIATYLRSRVTDTLTALRLLPAKKWQIYPNPLPRGTSLHLSWQTAPAGRYQVTLLNATGALIRERTIEVGGPGQVDIWNMAMGVPAGVYILRAVRPGQAEALTRELVLQ